MAKYGKTWIYCLTAGVFFAYFASESLLRQGVVSKIRPNTVTLESMIARLPSGTQDKINHRILMTNLKSRLAASSTVSERLGLMTSIAELTRDSAERVAVYGEILKNYPDEPGAYRAYVYFMFNGNESDRVSLSRFHEYTGKIGGMEKFNAWISAYNQFSSRKPSPSDEEKVVFLMPLSEEEAEFRDYVILYEELEKGLRRLKRFDDADRVRKIADEVFYQQSLQDFLNAALEAAEPPR